MISRISFDRGIREIDYSNKFPKCWPLKVTVLMKSSWCPQIINKLMVIDGYGAIQGSCDHRKPAMIGIGGHHGLYKVTYLYLTYKYSWNFNSSQLKLSSIYFYSWLIYAKKGHVFWAFEFDIKVYLQKKNLQNLPTILK